MDRFWSKVDRGTPDECWLWKAALFTRSRYGAFGLNGKHVGAHRVAWELTYGQIAPGLCVLHHCDNRSCVNPRHLFVGTRKDNYHDSVQKGRNCRGATHGLAKLTDSQVLAIRSDTRLLREIAADYGVHLSTIGKIKRRNMWVHI